MDELLNGKIPSAQNARKVFISVKPGFIRRTCWIPRKVPAVRAKPHAQLEIVNAMFHFTTSVPHAHHDDVYGLLKVDHYPGMCMPPPGVRHIIVISIVTIINFGDVVITVLRTSPGRTLRVYTGARQIDRVARAESKFEVG
jgi:hypothetical protein